MAEYEDTIIDVSKPNAGRVYDYLLGGNHNFDVDMEAAEQLVKIAPFVPKMMKLVRWFLHKGIKTAKERGFTHFLDFASGLPTEDHIHQNTPEGTKVIYSDIDPITVEYAHDIIGDNPDVKYMTCDAATPEIVLQSDTLASLFGDERKVAIGFNGVCYFLSDDQIRHALKILYDWAAPGSLLFLTDMDSENVTKETKAIKDLYKNQMNQPAYLRTKSKLIELLHPWKVEEPGLITPEEWYSLDPDVTNESREFLGIGMHSGFFIK